MADSFFFCLPSPDCLFVFLLHVQIFERLFTDGFRCHVPTSNPLVLPPPNVHSYAWRLAPSVLHNMPILLSGWRRRWWRARVLTSEPH